MDHQLQAYETLVHIENHLREMLIAYEYECVFNTKRRPSFDDLLYISSKITFVITEDTVKKLNDIIPIRSKILRMIDVTEAELMILYECRESLPNLPRVRRVTIV
ncbi:hypothetical protein [Halalkalibacter krulwichiae]|uniref:Uncharacterized protein n=1 Tax=Halalkalibacter krulwichiae TaxID=199441 RepID=A0A1X9MEH7_9BACI|nr:hypothetical protein [Halalkalibacter krulwichiae]ARK31845.1 hypothetical protein BkAM31D_19510 [Halalkalibacter krulwichiae]